MNLDKTTLHRKAYLLGLMTIAFGMPFSPVLMSIGQGIILFNWLIEGHLAEKLKCLFHNKAVLAIAGIVIIHLLGLLYTSNFEYALKDMRIKATILALLLVIPSTSPLSSKEFKLVLKTFLAGVFLASLISLYIYLGFYGPVDNARQLSPIISNIRLSLMICLAIFICIHLYLANKKVNRLFIFGILAIWFFLFMGVLGARVGYVAFFIIAIFTGIYKAWVYKKWWIAIIAAICIAASTIFSYQLIPTVKRRVIEVVWEFDLYNSGQKISSGSLNQRVIYWGIAKELIKENPVLGVGTGDIADVYKKYYETHDTGLLKYFQHRAHNQYLTIIITFGIIGFIVFLWGIFAPPYFEKKYADFIYLVFFIIFLLSMITEDTLETQAGATFYAFFNVLFLFAQPKTNTEILSE